MKSHVYRRTCNRCGITFNVYDRYASLDRFQWCGDCRPEDVKLGWTAPYYRVKATA